MPRLMDLTATDAIAAMRGGEIAAEDYARALLDQAERLAALNAFRTLDRDAVLEAARAADVARASGAKLGVLHGLPIPVKDSVNTKALPTSNGTRVLRDFRPRDDAGVLKPLLAQGALVMGKTNLHELSRGWTSNNGAFGAVRNPYDPERIPGGSSGGSAAAVAARIAPLALAEDTWGSIRVPASMCGLAGLRPTFGRYSGAGIMPLTLGKFDTAGPLARSVADLVLFDAVASGDARPIPEGSLQGARIGICAWLWSGLDSEVERVGREALRRLEDAGAVLVLADLPDEAREGLGIAPVIIGYENVASISAFLLEEGTGVGFGELLAQASANIRALYESLPARDAYEAALERRERLQAAIRSHFEAQGVEAIAFPALLAPAPPLGDNASIEVGGASLPIRTVVGRNTALGNCAGLASLILPAGLTAAGLPVGLEIDAPTGNDRRLLSLGFALERALGPIAAPACAA